jgi:hypothetical protein
MCRNGPIKDTQYLKQVHHRCPGVYGYAYDDGMGLLRCTPHTVYELTFFCPDEKTNFAKVAEEKRKRVIEKRAAELKKKADERAKTKKTKEEAEAADARDKPKMDSSLEKKSNTTNATRVVTIIEKKFQQRTAPSVFEKRFVGRRLAPLYGLGFFACAALPLASLAQPMRRVLASLQRDRSSVRTALPAAHEEVEAAPAAPLLHISGIGDSGGLSAGMP